MEATDFTCNADDDPDNTDEDTDDAGDEKETNAEVNVKEKEPDAIVTETLVHTQTPRPISQTTTENNK